jgi:molecular chaperone DnaK
MPMVRSMLTSMIGRAPRPGGNPDEAVALGAAVQAALLAAGRPAKPDSMPVAADSDPSPVAMTTPPPARPIAIHDVTALGLGIVTLNPGSGSSYNYVLLPRNSPVPGTGSAEFVTSQAGRTALFVEITEGDDDDLDYVTVVGNGTITLPYRAEQTPVRVAISFSADAVIYAEVFDGGDGRKLGDLQIERRSNLTPAQLDHATARLRRREVS